jgi:hypothetical protein
MTFERFKQLAERLKMQPEYREGLGPVLGSLMEDDPRYDIMPSVRAELQTRKERIFHLLQKLNAVLGLNEEEIGWIAEYGGSIESENTEVSQGND